MAQQKVSGNSDSLIKTESKSAGSTTPKDIRPGSPMSTVSTTPNSTASSHHSNNGDLKPLNGKKIYANNNRTNRYEFGVFFFAKNW